MDSGGADAVVSRRMQEKLRREMGDQMATWLSEPDVIEIMLNPDGTLWVDRAGRGMLQEGIMTASKAEAMMGTIAAVHGVVVNYEQPILECELPFDGSRFEGLLPPIVSAPAFAIRRHAIAIFTLDQYVEKGILTQVQRELIRKAVGDRRNILVVGGTGSGKTTLVNAIIGEMVDEAPDDRLVILEDTREIQCRAKNVVQQRTEGAIDMTALLRANLRLRPDRIIVGEVRGPEALALLKAWNTGHSGGAGTVHANSAKAGLTRVEQLVGESSQAPQPAVIAEAINVLIFIQRMPDGSRCVTEVVSVDGHDGHDYILTYFKE